MKKGLKEIVFIIDKSGSMEPLTYDTIGGFNSMLQKQKSEDVEALVSLVLFNDTAKVIYDRVDLNTVVPLTDKEYCTGGTTALLDALGGALHHIGNIHKYARDEDLPENTLFVITTDGMENSSRTYTQEKVKQMINRQEKKYGWEFIFMGANMDAVETAARYGISADRAFGWVSTVAGVATCFDDMDLEVTSFLKKLPRKKR